MTSSVKTVMGHVGGLASMAIGAAAVVGGIILRFAGEAGWFVMFPAGGRRARVLGVCRSGVALLIAGPRAAVRFGVVTLLVGIGMFIFGFSHPPAPALRFCAPLGFFVSRAGGL